MLLRPPLLLAVLAVAALTAGCDQLGIESASQVAARRDAEGKAIGGACRHAGRAIEDCYTLNRRSDKAAMYAGWREMDDYMRENKLEPVPAVLTPSAVAAAQQPVAEEAESGAKTKPADHAKAASSTKEDKSAEKAQGAAKPDAKAAGRDAKHES